MLVLHQAIYENARVWSIKIVKDLQKGQQSYLRA